MPKLGKFSADIWASEVTKFRSVTVLQGNELFEIVYSVPNILRKHRQNLLASEEREKAGNQPVMRTENTSGRLTSEGRPIWVALFVRDRPNFESYAFHRPMKTSKE
jgi:hypothetical protein